MLKGYKPVPRVASVIQVPEWILSVLISSADESSEKTELSLPDSEKKIIVLNSQRQTPLLQLHQQSSCL